MNTLYRVRAFNHEEGDDVRYESLEFDEVLDAVRDILLDGVETILIDTTAADLRFDIDVDRDEED